MPHEGEAGGLLVLDSYPTAAESRISRALGGGLGMQLRAIAQASGGPVAYATALRCSPKPMPIGEGAAALAPAIDKCRPYLKHALETLKPRRIIALGAPAIYALTGASITPSTMREGFAWLELAHGWVPVFYGISPAIAASNKFLAAWLREDFAKAVSTAPRTDPPVPGATYARLIQTESDALQCLSQVAPAEWTAVDCEWSGRPYDKDFKLLSLAMTPKGSLDAWVWTQESLRDPKCRALLTAWLRDPAHKKVGSYFKSDTVALHAALGIWTRGVAFDTRLLRRLMDAEASGKLSDMAHLVGRGGHKDELKDAMEAAVAAYKRAATKAKGGMFRVPLPGMAEQSHADKIMAGAKMEPYGFAFVEPALLYRYNAGDTVVTALVGELLERWLSEEPEGMQHVARTVVNPAGDAYARIESWGMKVDRAGLEVLGQYLDMQISEVESRLAQYGFNPENPKAGKFQPGSPVTLAKFLFGELGLKSTRTTDKGAQATDADALEVLLDQHPVVGDILKWRSLDKMIGTYVKAMINHIRDDGRVHPSIHPDGARTGRTSSSDPNFQNIPSVESPDPSQAELARMFKNAFVADAGFALLEVDYSQQELRIAADLSGDPAMIDIFKSGEDFHMRTAQLLAKPLWGIEPHEVTKSHRRDAKSTVFALLYDDSPYGIAMRMGIDKKKAEQLKEAVFGCYPVLAKWIQERVRETTRTGHAWTWWAGQLARRRPLIDIAVPDSKDGRTARRASWNGPIQGTANEYLVDSANAVVDWLVSNGIPAKLLVTIHDSMMLEVRKDCMSEVFDTVTDIMQGRRTKNGVPLMAEAKVGLTWAAMVEWKKGQPCPVEGCK